MKQTTSWILALIVLSSLALRLYLAFQTPYLEADGYFTARQIDSIKSTGTPLYKDSLSFSGSENIFAPGFYYVLSIFKYLMTDEQIIKIIPNIFAALATVFVFLISKEIVKDEESSLAAAALSAFMPIFFESTVNSGSPYTLFIPVFLFAIYSLIRAHETRYAYGFLAASIILPLIHPAAILLVIMIGIYFLFLRFEGFHTSRDEIKLLLFSLISILITVVIFYKAIMMHGLSILSANIPSQILSNFFANTSIIEAVYKIGLITVFYGTYSISKNIDRLTKQNTLIFSFIATAALILWTRKMGLNIGLTLLGIGLSIIIATRYQSLIDYIKNTKLPSYRAGIITITILAFLITAPIPSYLTLNEVMNSVPAQPDIAVLSWLKDKVPEGSVVIGSVQDGDYISNFAKKKDVIDSNFLLKGDAQQRYDDVKYLFETSAEPDALAILKKYDANYVFISQNVLRDYDFKGLDFYKDDTCFKPIISGKSILYAVTCLK